MPINDLPEKIRNNYEIHEWKHAITILKGDFPNEWVDLISILSKFRLKKDGLMSWRKKILSSRLDR